MERKLKEKLPGGAFLNVSEARSKTMGAIRGKHTKTTERRLRMAFIRAGIRGWTLHASDIPGKPDFYFPALRLAIFVDGCFWHGCPRCGHFPKTRTDFWSAKIQRNIERDKVNKATLTKMGIKVLRVWEHSLAKQVSTKHIIKKVQKHLVG